MIIMSEKVHPTIVFFGGDKTHREAAWEANSRTLDQRHRDVLRAVYEAKAVDLLDLNAAVMAALRTCATRGAQSTDRRKLAARIMILADYVQSALEGSPQLLVEPSRPRTMTVPEMDEWLG